MQPNHALTARLATLQSWRYGITTQIARIADYLRENGYSNAETESTFDKLTASANAASVTVIFIAEADRGKSELINALFFADLGRRLLPSGLLHATRCITEVRFDRSRKSGVSFLPIETREAPRRFREIFEDESAWRQMLFDADSPDSIASALGSLAETRRVSVSDAVAWGLHSESLSNMSRDGGWVDVPRWRYAVVNFPHPLLDAGLVVIDTPGLAILTAEPEFSRESIPSADAVIVVLDAGEGVTKPDLAIWKDKLGGSRNLRERAREESLQARLVVLNKIDRLYIEDPLDPTVADRNWLKEVDKRVQDVADLMRIDPLKVLPVSAALALKGSFEGDQDAQLKSRLYRLEKALASNLPPNAELETGKTIADTLSGTLESVQASLDQDRFDRLEALRTLADVRKKNGALLDALGRHAGDRAHHLEAARAELRAIKPMHSKFAAELAVMTSTELAKADASEAAMEIAAGTLSSKTSDALTKYFAKNRRRLDEIDKKLDEIRTLFGNLGEKHFRSVGLGHHEVHSFATHRFLIELDKAEEIAIAELTRSGNVLVRRASTLAEQFELVVAPKIVHIYEIASRESTAWMRGVFLGIERPLVELEKRFVERNHKIAVIRSAELDLAEKIAESQAALDVIKSKHHSLSIVREGLDRHTGNRRKADSQ